MSLDISLQVFVDTGGDEPRLIVLDETNMNATHNLVPMWARAGCYDALYESHGKVAGETLPSLTTALAAMECEPDVYRALNPANGWGDYDGALKFLRAWRTAVADNPKAIIRVSR